MDNFISVNDKLLKEFVVGRIVGLFDFFFFEIFRVLFLGIVFKKLLGEFRLIYYLFYLEGFFVNDGIFKELVIVRYVIIDDVVWFIKVIGKGCFLVKIDIKFVFCIIFVVFCDFLLLGMEW